MSKQSKFNNSNGASLGLKSKIYTIDRKRVSRLSLSEQEEYFMDLKKQILEEPVHDPKEVWLGSESYYVNGRNAKVLKEVFGELKRINQLKIDAQDEPLYELNWEYIKELNLSERVEEFSRMITRIEHRPLTNQLVYKDEYGTHIINKVDYPVYAKILREREQAKKGVDTLENYIVYRGKLFKKNDKKKTKEKKVKEPKAPKKPKVKKEKKKRISLKNRIDSYFANKKEKKAQKSKKGSIVGIGLVSIGALALCGAYVATNVVPVFTLPWKKDKDLEEDKTGSKTEITDFFISPYTEHVIEKNYIFPSEEEIAEMAKEKEEQESKPDTRSDREKLIDGYFEEYSAYFNLDSNKVIEIARTMTNDYNNPFLDSIGNYLYDLSDDEAASMIFLYLLSRDELMTPLSEFGMTKEDLVISHEVITTDKDKVLILRTGETFGEFVGRISELLKMDKNYALAIAYTVDGLNSGVDFHDTNNFSGAKTEGEHSQTEYVVYPSPEAGIISYLIDLKQYEEKNVNSLEELSGLYISGIRSMTYDDWVTSVQMFYELITKNPEDYFGPEALEERGKVLAYEAGTHY